MMIKILFICLCIYYVQCDTDDDNPGIAFELHSYGKPKIEITSQNLNEINKSLHLAILIHHFGDSPNDPKFVKLRDSIEELRTHNVLVVDWESITTFPLLKKEIIPNFEKIANYIGRLISKLHTDFGYNLDSVHIIGHSLGAQLGGEIASAIFKTTSVQIGRITGLDPAGSFYLKDLGIQKIENRLHQNSAKMVDVVHTDGGLRGTLHKMGKIDFIANCGTRYQPHCIRGNIVEDMKDVAEDTCNYWASLEYFTSSIHPLNKYRGIQCHTESSWYCFGLCGSLVCDENDVAELGLNVPLDKNGTYYFNTLEDPPYQSVIDVKKFKQCPFFR